MFYYSICWRNMAVLNEQNKIAVEVTLCVPDNADGAVRWVKYIDSIDSFSRCSRLEIKN
jgi:hypothetical protein